MPYVEARWADDLHVFCRASCQLSSSREIPYTIFAIHPQFHFSQEIIAFYSFPTKVLLEQNSSHGRNEWKYIPFALHCGKFFFRNLCKREHLGRWWEDGTHQKEKGIQMWVSRSNLMKNKLTATPCVRSDAECSSSLFLSNPTVDDTGVYSAAVRWCPSAEVQMTHGHYLKIMYTYFDIGFSAL